MKKEVYGGNKDRNIEEKFLWFLYLFLKQNKNENSWLLTTNGSTNHANLLVIVASHVSLAITSPWLKMKVHLEGGWIGVRLI